MLENLVCLWSDRALHYFGFSVGKLEYLLHLKTCDALWDRITTKRCTALLHIALDTVTVSLPNRDGSITLRSVWRDAGTIRQARLSNIFCLLLFPAVVCSASTQRNHHVFHRRHHPPRLLGLQYVSRQGGGKLSI